MDVLPGTGISKYVFNVQIIGFSTVIMSVFLFLISVLLLIIVVLVSVAIKDITLRMENAQ